MAEVDLFEAIDTLFTKKPLPGTPPSLFILHRFLASDPDFAVAARYIQKDIRDRDRGWAAWRGLMPINVRGAPRLRYVGTKKQPAAEALTVALMEHLAERRSVVEDILRIAESAGTREALYYHHGIEPPAESENG